VADQSIHSDVTDDAQVYQGRNSPHKEDEIVLVLGLNKRAR